ncbi:unnamed protein product, partial [Ranitomeya imitator]
MTVVPFQDIARILQEKKKKGERNIIHRGAQKTLLIQIMKELARWLNEKEQQSYRKPKGRGKRGVRDRKRPDEAGGRFLQHQMKITVMIYGHDYTNHNPHNSSKIWFTSHIPPIKVTLKKNYI